MLTAERVQFEVYFQAKCHCFVVFGQIVIWECFCRLLVTYWHYC